MNAVQKSEGLLIPCAIAENGRIVHAYEGSRGGLFLCPGCLSPVQWRKCDEADRRSHFAHEPGSPCTESQVHGSAKRLVAQQINDWRDGVGRRPVYFARCSCGRELEPTPIRHVSGAANVEHRLPSGRVPDVFCGFAIEIFYRHAIEDDKIDVLKRAGVDWIELDAEPILQDPSKWIVRRSGGTLKESRLCAACLARLRDEHSAEAKRLTNWEQAIRARHHEAADREHRSLMRSGILANAEMRLARREQEANETKLIFSPYEVGVWKKFHDAGFTVLWYAHPGINNYYADIDTIPRARFGGRWHAGVDTGPDGDLICVKHCASKEEAEDWLSPGGYTPELAVDLALSKILEMGGS